MDQARPSSRSGIEVEVGLGVGADPPGRGEQQGEVDGGGEEAGGAEPLDPRSNPDSPPGGGVGGEGAHEAGGRRLPGELVGATAGPFGSRRRRGSS